MPSKERTTDRARMRVARIVQSIGIELRTARLSAGRTQRDVALAARMSQTKLSRLERGQLRSPDLMTVGVVSALVGLDLAVNLYPGPRVIRDAAQVRLLQRLRDRLGDDWLWRYEVPVAPGDQRAWDARVRHRRTQLEFVVEAETRIQDIQATLRRIALKRQAAGGVRVVLLVADTHHNRAAIAAGRLPLLDEFPCPQRSALRALANGIDPEADCLVLLGPTRAESSHA